MNSLRWHSQNPRNSNPWLCVLALALLVGCKPTPSVTETLATPIVATPQTTALPPTALPPTPTTLRPTALAATPAAPEALTDSATAQTDAGILASAGYLVYQRPDGSLWRAEGNGQPPIGLTGPTETAALLPWAAAPDGKTIAVILGTGLWYTFHENPTLALWLVEADGSNLRKIQDLLPPRGVDLTPGGDDAFNLAPALTFHQELAWSPDGQLIAFVSAHQDQVDLYTASLDGKIMRLTNTPRLEQGPHWSPDGALIAYRTTSGFGTGAGWGDVALEATARSGGPPALVMDDRKLASGSAAVAVPDLLWISPTVIVAGIADVVVGNAELRALDTGTRTSTVIFDAPYSALAWNDATGQLAIAGTSESILQANMDARKLAAGLFTWSPDAGPPIQIEHAPVEVLAWTPQGDALAYSAGGEHPELRLWAIGAEGDLKPLATQPAKQLRWSLDGQRLATDTMIYTRAGQLLGDRSNDQPAILIDWGPQGLFFATAEGNNHDLWLWDDTLPQHIDSKLTTTQSAGVVLARP
jgi:WD40 repeat protein